MAFKMVKEYWAWWDIDTHFGEFQIKTDDNIVTPVQVTDAREFAVIIDLLRNEKPLAWDKTLKRLSTSSRHLAAEPLYRYVSGRSALGHDLAVPEASDHGQGAISPSPGGSLWGPGVSRRWGASDSNRIAR